MIKLNKKCNIYILLVYTLFFTFFLGSITFSKNNVSKIEMDITLRNNGSAHIAETWSGIFNEGTEIYKPIDDNLLYVRDLKVSKDGRDFLEVARWNTTDSFKNKTWRCGINKTNKGVELCFGISEYGNNSYTFNYDIDPIVKSYNDYDGFNFQFINPNMDTTPTNIMIRLHHENPDLNLSTDNTRIWAFGFDGETLIGDNYAIAFSSTSLNASNYANIMMRFNKGLFVPNTKVNGSFEVLKDTAFEDSFYQDVIDYQNETNKASTTDSLIDTITPIAFAILFLFSFFAPLFFIIKRHLNLKGFYKNANYFRDTPNNGNIAVSHALFSDFDIWNSKESNVVGALITKMIIDKNLYPIEEKSYGLFGNEKINTSLKIGDAPSDPLTKELYDIITLASGTDKILQENELRDYLKKNPSPLTSFVDSITAKGHNYLNDNNCYNKVLGKNLTDLNDKGKAELSEVYGLRKFLDEFSLIKEKTMREGIIFENLLVYATLFGIADKVLRDFKKIYPDKLIEIEDYTRTIYISNIYYRTITRSILDRHNRNLASKASRMAASGFGGSTSLGGGGGFSGGGSGGGTR